MLSSNRPSPRSPARETRHEYRIRLPGSALSAFTWRISPLRWQPHPLSLAETSDSPGVHADRGRLPASRLGSKVLRVDHDALGAANRQAAGAAQRGVRAPVGSSAPTAPWDVRPPTAGVRAPGRPSPPDR